jgi:hypothetical protein
VLEASVYAGRGFHAASMAFGLEEMYGDGGSLFAYLGGNTWERADPEGLSWDPFAMVDDYMEEMAAERAAFLTAIGKDLKAVAIVGATIASYLPFPAVSLAGELALASLNGNDPTTAIASASLALVPGGKLAKGIAGLTNRIGAKALGIATSYAQQHAGAFVNTVSQAAPGLAGRAKAVVSKTAASVDAWLNAGPSNTVVYLAFRDGNPWPVYVGITDRSLRVRRLEHNRRGKNFAELRGITPELPRRKAMAIETVLILANPQFENKKLSIGWKNPFFDDAVHAGTSWFTGRGQAIFRGS